MSSEPKSADKLQAEIAREYRNFKPSDEVRQLAEELFASEPCEATPDHVLRTQVMDSRIPKNEREWWAKREIESQQARIEALTTEVEEQARLLGASGSREAELMARIEALEKQNEILQTECRGYDCCPLAPRLNRADDRVEALEKAAKDVLTARERLGRGSPHENEYAGLVVADMKAHDALAPLLQEPTND